MCRRELKSAVDSGAESGDNEQDRDEYVDRRGTCCDILL